MASPLDKNHPDTLQLQPEREIADEPSFVTFESRLEQQARAL